ncbi:MAG: hypothetical protein M3Q74_05460 [Pseudomonadota bacterium]|nr:hypothetical protein [Pseudomonadota bacterium]
MKRITVLAGLGLAALALGGCDEMRVGFEKGMAEGKAKAEAERAEKAAPAEAPAPAAAETPGKAPTPAG